MTDDQINLKLAEWCEPKPPPQTEGDEPRDLVTYSPQGFWASGEDFDTGQPLPWVPRYDFPNSCDDCAKFEALLVEREGMWPKYTVELFMVLAPLDSWSLLKSGSGSTGERWTQFCTGERWTQFCFATAAAHQRCQALLRVIGEQK
jgi:hypothetical protein